MILHRMTLLAAVLLAALLTSCACDVGAKCTTDTECAELCPSGTRDLPVDHPDYCDGGPNGTN